MKKSYKLNNSISQYPVLFWGLFLPYIISIIILTMTKREMNIYPFIISFAIVCIGLMIYYRIFASDKQKQLTIKWLKLVFLLSKNNKKKVLHRILFLSGWGATFGSLAFLSFLFRFHWIVSLILFLLQIIISIIILGNYIGNKRIANMAVKIQSGVILGAVYILLDFISQNLGRSFVTEFISVPPEQIPTITQGLYWFSFILIASIFLQLIAIFWTDLAKNRKLSYKLPFITYFLVFMSIALPSQLIIFNGVSIIETSVVKTYIADTMIYFKCNNKIIKNVPNTSARYLKVDEQEFRVFYFEEDKSSIQLTTLLCDGSNYIEENIHK
ncbi:hypothetical protein GCM10023211_21910 [Orbus sasakiae]|uniref:Uncharacterized protein n=1 Tax=Orbus sasakiae TaxID=1078475 RepID=A0ABP9NBB4_9GAMM